MAKDTHSFFILWYCRGAARISFQCRSDKNTSSDVTTQCLLNQIRARYVYLCYICDVPILCKATGRWGWGETTPNPQQTNEFEYFNKNTVWKPQMILIICYSFYKFFLITLFLKKNLKSKYWRNIMLEILISLYYHYAWNI